MYWRSPLTTLVATPVPLMPVESSNIAAVGYLNTDCRLFIQFKSGMVYSYEYVTQDQFKAFLNAESLGKYFAEHFRPAQPHTCTILGRASLPAAPEPAKFKVVQEPITQAALDDLDAMFARRLQTLAYELQTKINDLALRVESLELELRHASPTVGA
jgi:hypothetical protein